MYKNLFLHGKQQEKIKDSKQSMIWFSCAYTLIDVIGK